MHVVLSAAKGCAIPLDYAFRVYCNHAAYRYNASPAWAAGTSERLRKFGGAGTSAAASVTTYSPSAWAILAVLPPQLVSPTPKKALTATVNVFAFASFASIR